MVVAEVVRIRNSTLRTFVVEAGDPFYTAQIDGKPVVDGIIEVPPGFDQASDGLFVPWENIGALVIAESKSDDCIRCVVGPMAADEENRDWLQFRGNNWELLAQERWWALGRRHYMGAVGGSVEVELSFRDPRGQPTSTASLVEVTHFEKAVACAPPNVVFLNVFDLASALQIPNAMLCNTMIKSVGAFHAAVEVYGEEWSFYRTPNAHSCGVCKSLRPRHHPVHVYRQSINLGVTNLRDWEVRYLIRASLAPKWLGGSYDLLHRNCIHFCDELLLNLGTKAVPPWVKGLHETGGAIFRIPWPLSIVFGTEEASALEDGNAGDVEELLEGEGDPGLPAGGEAPPDANFVDLGRDSTPGSSPSVSRQPSTANGQPQLRTSTAEVVVAKA
jgi:hypothetical protein